MDWLLIILLVGGGILLGLRLWLEPAEDQPAVMGSDEDPITAERYEPEPWETEALGRYRTETSIDQLVSEGRGR